MEKYKFSVRIYENPLNDQKMCEILFPNNPKAQEKITHLLLTSMPATQKRRKLIEILRSEDEESESYEDLTDESNISNEKPNTPVKTEETCISINVADSSSDRKSKRSPKLKIAESLEKQKKYLDSEFLRIPGQIERYFPNNDEIQQKVRRILKKPMPANKRTIALQKLYDERTKKFQAMSTQDHVNALLARLAARPTRIYQNDTDDSDESIDYSLSFSNY